MNSPRIFRPSNGLSDRQMLVRRRAKGRSLHDAVRLAVLVFFRFTHRRKVGEALWCETERVWLGNKTFIQWAIFEADIDIPRVVATSTDAPETSEGLRAAVRAELTACWTDKLASLPQRETPCWLPLP
jgi:hypothetical protein